MLLFGRCHPAHSLLLYLCLACAPAQVARVAVVNTAVWCPVPVEQAMLSPALWFALDGFCHWQHGCGVGFVPALSGFLPSFSVVGLFLLHRLLVLAWQWCLATIFVTLLAWLLSRCPLQGG
jgi:hypothetical protein